ncbi:MAG: transcriptional repressor LexA [Candidatus Paceibacterota bacterium]|jgi:repressor LexA
MIDEYKDKIISFYQKNKRMPVYTEIMKLVGFKSKNAVHKLLNKLIEEGSLSKDNTGRLIPGRSFNEIPLLGLVEAGFPTSTEEALTDTIDIGNYLIKDKGSSYLFEVKGDSMIEEGIREGDLVIADKKGEPKDGDIVIAYVDGGWTIKFLKKKSGKTWLEPANKNYKPIYPTQELKVAAIVKGVIRKY